MSQKYVQNAFSAAARALPLGSSRRSPRPIVGWGGVPPDSIPLGDFGASILAHLALALPYLLSSLPSAAHASIGRPKTPWMDGTELCHVTISPLHLQLCIRWLGVRKEKQIS